MSKVQHLPTFQFHKVRLKEQGLKRFEYQKQLFQFHKVRLKDRLCKIYHLHGTLFQFHKVRLKVSMRKQN